MHAFKRNVLKKQVDGQRDTDTVIIYRSHMRMEEHFFFSFLHLKYQLHCWKNSPQASSLIFRLLGYSRRCQCCDLCKKIYAHVIFQTSFQTQRLLVQVYYYKESLKIVRYLLQTSVRSNLNTQLKLPYTIIENAIKRRKLCYNIQ